MNDASPPASGNSPESGPTSDASVESSAVPHDVSPSDAPRESLSRRGLVKGAAATAGIATVAGFWFEGFGIPARRRAIEPTRPGDPLRFFTPAMFATLSAVVDRLLPSGGPDSPGARDANTAAYFDALLATDEMPQKVKDRVRRGLGNCDSLAQRHFRARSFSQLSSARRDAVLRGIERKREGVHWLRNMIELTLECFFGDPVHGGNPGEIGWRWIDHRPGTPRPVKANWQPKEFS